MKHVEPNFDDGIREGKNPVSAACTVCYKLNDSLRVTKGFLGKFLILLHSIAQSLILLRGELVAKKKKE